MVAWYTSDIRDFDPTKKPEDNWWAEVNAALYTRNKEALSSLRDGIWFLQSAYEKLSKNSQPCTLWRGIDKRLTQVSQYYGRNKKVCWPSFTSASKKQSVMMDFADRGGSLIKIEAVRYAEFAGLSMRPLEAESLLGINTLVEVQNAIPSEHLAGFPGVESIPPNVDLIVVKQIPTPPFGILRLPSVSPVYDQFEPGQEPERQMPTRRLPQAPLGRPNRRWAFTAIMACAALLAIVLGIGLSHGPFGILRIPSVSPLPTNSAKRFIHYLTPVPQSHAECWAGNAPTTLHEKATVEVLFQPTRPTHEGFTTSHAALMCGSAAAAKLVFGTLHDAGSITTDRGLTLLHAAALGGQPPDVLQQLVQRGCSPTAKDAHGCSVMHYAAAGGCVDTLKYILKNGGNMNDKGSNYSDGYTVMMAAAYGGSVEAMKFILANGGTMTDKDKDGHNVMMAAARGGSVEAMKFILAKGGNMADKDNSGWTAMMYALKEGSVEAMKFVLDNGGSLTEKDNSGYTLMMAAAYGGSVEAMKFVLANGGSVTDKDNSGHTVMAAAALSSSVEAMKFVLDNGGSMTDKDNHGHTVMESAALRGSVEAMKFVLDNGGRLTHATMIFAAFSDSVEAMKFVLDNGGSMKGVLRWCHSDETKKFCRSSGGD